MNLINDTTKSMNRINRNYFFIGTFLVVLFNFLVFYKIISLTIYHFSELSGLNYIMYGFLQSFRHANTQHLFLNMLCFAVTGIYLERKYGSISIIFLVLLLSFCASTTMSTSYQSTPGVGFSGVNYAIYGYIIIDYLFYFFKKPKEMFNLILGVVVICLIYVAMCFCGGTSTFEFKIYPFDLITHTGHSSGFIAGIIIGITLSAIKAYYCHYGKISEEKEMV